MFDCAKNVRAYHDKEVNLPTKEQDAMRDRRDANRKRVLKGLAKADKPAPIEFVKQGSYAMKTMVQAPNNDYDIDDGVYFRKEDLVGARGAEMTSHQARQMVRDAVDHGDFKRAPEVRPNCVRVFYQEGYHVDLPVYRRVVKSTIFGEKVYNELASSTGWKRSDARLVSKWYEQARSEFPDGHLVLRINRDLKKFAKSRQSWQDDILRGFGISVLVVDRFQHDEREDRALYETMVAIRDRLNWTLQIAHPVTPNEYLTTGHNDARARCFRDKLDDAISWLKPLFDSDCTREQAHKCWDKVFATTFFSERLEKEKGSSGTKSAIGSATILTVTSGAAGAVSAAGSGRFA